MPRNDDNAVADRTGKRSIDPSRSPAVPCDLSPVASIRSHRDLIVWQKAMDLTVEVYDLAKRFPKDETYRLVSQLTRAAASVPANIAEGHARGSPRDYAHFLAIAKGSLMETETFVTLGVRLGYTTDPEAERAFGLITEISKMLTALRGRLL